MRLDTEKIKKILLEKGLTITELAEKIGVTYASTHRVISGKSFPRPGTLKKICDELKVKAKDIIIYD